MGFFTWIIFGAIVGWIASLITGNSERMGCLTNILVGIVGSAIGGLIGGIFMGEAAITGFNLGSFIMALIGALILLGITGYSAQRTQSS